MKKQSLVVLGIILMMGCAKKKSTLDDQVAPPPPPPVTAAEPRTSDESSMMSAEAMREQELRKDAEAALRTLYFGYNLFVLNEESRDILAGVGDFMKKYKGVKISIDGHCDERGSDEYNMALGQKRADEARRYLTTYGIESSRISTMSWGKEKPAVMGSDESAWMKNRRDEFSYKK